MKNDYLEKLNKIYIDMLFKMLQDKPKQYFYKALDTVINVYRNANSSKHFVYVNIWDAIKDQYYSYLSNNDIDVLQFWDRFKNLHHELEKNIDKAHTQTHSFEWLIIWTYNSLKSNKDINNSGLNSSFDILLKNYISHTIFPHYENVYGNKDFIEKVHKNEVMHILKWLIDYKIDNFFLDVFNSLLESIVLNRKSSNYIIVNISVYLYYLASQEKEPYITNDESEYYKRLLKQLNYKRWISRNNSSLGDISQLIDLTTDEWERWNPISGKNFRGKKLILDDVKIKFALFLNILTHDVHNMLDCLIKNPDIGSSTDLFLLLGDEQIETSILDLNEISRLFYNNLSINLIRNKLNDLSNALKFYHKTLLEEQLKVNLKKIKISKIEETITREMKEIADNQFLLFNHKLDNILTGNYPLLSVSNVDLEELEKINILEWESFISDSLWNLLIYINKNNIKLETIDYTNNEALKLYFSLNEKYKDFNVNTIINLNNIKFHGSNEDINRFLEITKDLIRVDFYGNNSTTLVINKDLMYLNIKNINVNIRSYTDSEIKAKFTKLDTGKYLYPDPYATLEFEEQEFFNFIAYKKKVIDISCDYEFCSSDFIGYGIELDLNND